MTASSRRAIEEPPLLPGYEWIRDLGSGGFADVHLYRQQVPARRVAVKVVRRTTDAEGRAQLHREANSMAAVAGHPAIVELHGVGTTDDGRPYLVMEYCPVADVGEQIRVRPMPLDRALDVVIRLCGGLEMIHRAKIVHRDVKPGNIMMDAYGAPVLSDFGVASRIGALEEGALDGFSVLWAPPEQHDPTTHAHPTQDVWAMATTAWTLLTGRSPFEEPVGDNSAAGIAARVQDGRLRPLGRSDAPPELEAALRAAITVDPARRTRSAAELGRALQYVQELMGKPVTQMDLREDPFRTPLELPDAQAPIDLDDDEEATRLRATPPIDESTRMHSPDFSLFAQAPQEDEWTVRAAPGSDTPPSSIPTATGRRGTHPATLLALVLVGAVVTGTIVVAMLTQGGRIIPPPGGSDLIQSHTPVDDPVPTIPEAVSKITAKVEGKEIVWTWEEGSSAQERTYVWVLRRPGNKEETGSVTGSNARTEAASGRNCLELVVVGEAGRQSDPVEECIDVP